MTNKEEMIKISYASIMGSLMFSMICMMINFAYDVSLVSIFMANPGKAHWFVVKW